MKKTNLLIYVLIMLSFLYIIINLNESIIYYSEVLVMFYKRLLPYLLLFLLINQFLIRTNLIYLIGYLLQFVTYPLFGINAKSATLIMISLIGGFPSSVLYSSLAYNEKRIELDSAKKIGLYLFLPSINFLLYIIKPSIGTIYFFALIIALYLPIIVYFIFHRNSDKFTHFKEVSKEIKDSYNNFNFIKEAKETYKYSIETLINILGTISFFSIISVSIDNLFLKGLLEFSLPITKISTSHYNDFIKTLAYIFILTFSSFSSIAQANLYLADIEVTNKEFIKTRLSLVLSSLIIYFSIISLYMVF